MKLLNDISYSYAIINTEKLKNKLLIRSDPNFNSGYYTEQNIPVS